MRGIQMVQAIWLRTDQLVITFKSGPLKEIVQHPIKNYLIFVTQKSAMLLKETSVY
ncbi:hypothetical protein KSP39_PZI023959 [Platanthera zijinensis]|uniref:Uncharacterized protein n=1 Tax=Platanthera zijinensis TaxID=2320716 RepID=A0AAP0AU42_9ASPA